MPFLPVSGCSLAALCDQLCFLFLAVLRICFFLGFHFCPSLKVGLECWGYAAPHIFSLKMAAVALEGSAGTQTLITPLFLFSLWLFDIRIPQTPLHHCIKPANLLSRSWPKQGPGSHRHYSQKMGLAWGPVTFQFILSLTPTQGFLPPMTTMSQSSQ